MVCRSHILICSDSNVTRARWCRWCYLHPSPPAQHVSSSLPACVHTRWWWFKTFLFPGTFENIYGPQLYLYWASWFTVWVHNKVPKTGMVVFLFNCLLITLILCWHSFHINSSHLREREAKNSDELVLPQQNPRSNKFRLEIIFAHRTTNT